MSWKSQLRKASFRDVAFDVLQDSALFGRRTVLHEYPFRDAPFVEDLGRSARRMQISAILLGDDYMERRDKLIAAIETAGSGLLVHPQFGEMRVSIDQDVTIDHSSAEGGCCRITFGCVESGQITFPLASSATSAVVADNAESVLDIADGLFADGFSLDGLSSLGITDALDRAAGWLDDIQGAVSAAASAVTAPLAAVNSAVTSMRSSLNQLLAAPENFAASARSLVGSISDALDPPSARSTLTSMSGYGEDETVIESTTATRVAMANNRTSFNEYVNCAVAAQAAVSLSEVEFTDYSDAITQRDDVLDALDSVADTTAHDELYHAITALRAAVVRDVAARGADLARIVTITPAYTQPALVLAYTLYNDASYDLELVTRNAGVIERPGFVPGGVALEVAIDG
jgi:prophage DNA circulation protein